MKNINFIRLHKMICNYCIHEKSEYSQQEIKNNISKYGVKIGNEIIFNHQKKIMVFDKVDISHWPVREKGDFENIIVLYENDNFMAINKPINTVVMAGIGHKYNNIISFLENKLGIQLYVIHRLDKDTSGIMLIAKNQETKDRIQDLFKKRLIMKEYLALVSGEVKGVYNIRHYQSRDKSNMLRQKLHFSIEEARNYSDEARECKSIITPLFYCNELNLSIVKVKILTGRMHQIRVLMESLGHPLFEDKIYNEIVEPNQKFVFCNYETVSKKFMIDYIKRYNNSLKIKYFLCSVILDFTLEENSKLKNYAFNLMV